MVERAEGPAVEVDLRLDTGRGVVGYLVVVSRDPKTGRCERIEPAEVLDVGVQRDERPRSRFEGNHRSNPGDRGDPVAVVEPHDDHAPGLTPGDADLLERDADHLP